MGTHINLPSVPTRPFSLECALLYIAIFHLDRGEPELALKWRFRCNTDDHKIALFTQHIPTLATALAKLRHPRHPRRSNGTYIRDMYDNVNYKVG